MTKQIQNPVVTHTVVHEHVIISDRGFDNGDNLYPYTGCCCMVNSFYPKFPECLGIACEGTILCMSLDIEFAKPKHSGNPEHCFTCLKALIDCHKVTTCIKLRQQAFCLDSRCAIPTVEGVPCIINAAGITCCYAHATTCRCCATLSNLEAAKVEK